MAERALCIQCPHYQDTGTYQDGWNCREEVGSTILGDYWLMFTGKQDKFPPWCDSFKRAVLAGRIKDAT